MEENQPKLMYRECISVSQMKNGERASQEEAAPSEKV